MFQMFMCVLDHDDGAVNHGADGDGDAAEAHDIGVDSLPAHDEEGDKNTDRQGKNGDERRTRMQKKQQADQ